MSRNEKKPLSLDSMLTAHRLADASRIANEIMGTGPHRKHNHGRNYRNRVGPYAHQPAAGGSASGAASSDGKWQHDLHSRINPGTGRVSKVVDTKVSSTVAKQLRDNKLFVALHGDQIGVRGDGGTDDDGSQSVYDNADDGGESDCPGENPNVFDRAGQQHQGRRRTQGEDAAQKPVGASAASSGYRILGTAGPSVIQASNFAPGTTAQDIYHAMQPVGKIISCIILTAVPNIIAEIVFENKKAAEKCIRQYHGKEADGRPLDVQFKTSPPVAQIAGYGAQQQQRRRRSMSSDPFAEREEADRRRREQNIHFQDGRYGMNLPPLYSDALLQKGRGFVQYPQ